MTEKEHQLLKKVINFVDKINNGKSPHFAATLKWVKKIKPNADVALQIAAYSHDIERPARKKSTEVHDKKYGFMGKSYMHEHQTTGGKIMANFLKQNNVEQKIINKVKHLIENHEYGGDKESNILKDADSASFFEKNIQHFLNRFPDFSKRLIQDKFDFMFSRITNQKVKKIIKPLYLKAINKLEKI
ncbi:DUF4202 domain-containing protein [Candidatus Kuenenbacteria bacterium]|nr:DUF4202 domain-containing protein [Candidatus Kuenenbacteria bacterium]